MVCNIFKPLEKENGTFLLFSQYSEDLTREATQSEYYRVTPSKFIALDIDYSTSTNDDIARYLQNAFENGCAVCRGQMENKWTPNNSANLFWNAMFNKWLKIAEGDPVIEQVRYVGDINMQSYNEHEGMGYSEVYCYIPTESKCYNYKGIAPNLEGSTKYEHRAYIEGYEVGELNNIISGMGDWGLIENNYSYYPLAKWGFSWDDNSVEGLQPNSITQYNINTIIVLYDVLSRDTTGATTLYKNIPMGIYFTGLVKDNQMTNPVTKYISNSDIYGSGTSYGLKICSRFTCTPNSDSLKTVDIVTGGDEALLSQLLAQMSVSQSKMDNLVSKMQENIQTKKDLYAAFKNSRTNVPYIKQVGDKQYWFVNGRNVGQAYIDSLNGDSDELINQTGLIVTLNIKGAHGEECFDASEIQPDGYDVILTWQTTYNDKVIQPDTLELNGAVLDNKTTSQQETNAMPGNKFTIKVTKFEESMAASSTNIIPMVYPTYFVFTATNTPTEQEIKDAVANNGIKEAIPSRHQVRTYTSNMGADYENNYTGFMTLAYPSSFGALTHIFDKTGFDYITDFEPETKVFTFGDKQVPYYLYTEKNKVGVEKYTLEFK